MTHNATAADWRAHAHRLADDLEQAGKLTTPRWRAALLATPRHHLVPTYYRQARDGTWQIRHADTPEGLAEVYTNTALITALATNPTGTIVLSSSTQPGLMTRMLEALDVQDEHRVLEIGTGTGYNAALLCHRLGDDQVFSIDVEHELLTATADRLAGLGYCPLLTSGDGAGGLPEHAPFDRIIATCAVPAIPWAWVDQTVHGGVILTDLKTAPGAGSLVRLTRTGPNRAEGRFDATYAAFMGLRHTPGASTSSWRVDRDHGHAEYRTTSLDPNTPWTSMLVWFLASFHLGSQIAYGYTIPDGGVSPAYSDTAPTASWIATPDGSWAEITLIAENGMHSVVEGGPRRLWHLVEDAHNTWTGLGRPGWDRFGLTVTPGAHTVFVDDLDSGHTWRLCTH